MTRVGWQDSTLLAMVMIGHCYCLVTTKVEVSSLEGAELGFRTQFSSKAFPLELCSSVEMSSKVTTMVANLVLSLSSFKVLVDLKKPFPCRVAHQPQVQPVHLDRFLQGPVF